MTDRMKAVSPAIRYSRWAWHPWRKHWKRGFSGSPVLTDLNGDGKLDIIVTALHLA